MANHRDYPRSSRMSAQLRAELSALLSGSLIHDPRVAGVNLTVTQVEVTKDMGHAHVYVSSFGDDATLASAVQGLNHASGKLRNEIGKRIQVRYVPLLSFVVDMATREGDRISALIRTATAQDKANAESRGESPDDPKAAE